MNAIEMLRYFNIELENKDFNRAGKEKVLKILMPTACVHAAVSDDTSPSDARWAFNMRGSEVLK